MRPAQIEATHFKKTPLEPLLGNQLVWGFAEKKISSKQSVISELFQANMRGGLAGCYDSDVEAGGLANQMGGGGFGEKAVSKNNPKTSPKILSPDFVFFRSAEHSSAKSTEF